jgi:hypothetical protein
MRRTCSNKGKQTRTNMEGIDMRRYIVCSLACGVLIFGAWTENILCQTLTPILQATHLTAWTPTVFSPAVYKLTGGTSAAYADATTHLVYLTTICTFGNAFAEAGFYSATSSTNTGTTDLPGVTVSATFEVLNASGDNPGLIVGCQERRSGTWYNLSGNTPNVPPASGDAVQSAASKAQPPGAAMSVVGVGPTTVTSKTSFTMKPNTEYRGVAYVKCSSGISGRSASCYAKITSININAK